MKVKVFWQSVKDNVEGLAKHLKRPENKQAVVFCTLMILASTLNSLFGVFVLSKLLTWFVAPVGFFAAAGIKLIYKYLTVNLPKVKDEKTVYINKEDAAISELGTSIALNTVVLFIGFIISLFV